MWKHALTAASALLAAAQAVDLKVASSGGNSSSPLQYGVMFEDINHSGDGGIYAELVQNRAFQGSAVFPSTLDAWFAVGSGASLSLQNLSQPVSSALPTSMRVSINSGYGSREVGFGNTGWWGMDVKVQKYTGTFWVKGSYKGSFTASLQSALTNETFGSVEIESEATSGAWTQHSYTLTPDSAAPNVNNTLVVTFDASGVSGGFLDFNFISLFPPTYNDRPNGLRIDLMEALADLNPSFHRMPGGNNLEGNLAPYLWYWNETIGPLIDRPGRPGTWGYENTDGLGLVEYLQWCQDLSMEPILAVWAGFYLDGTAVPQDELQPWIQYALDELEFLMGDETTTWGAKRIALGYPEPFPINYVEVGNEDNLNGGAGSYSAYRFPMFYDAIKAAYPDIFVIGSTVDIDPFPGDAGGDYHQYTRPNYFVSQFNFFDNFSADHKVLVGEYATVQPNVNDELPGPGVDWSAGRPKFPFWIGSVAEAVFLLGTERNGHKMIGASYAPGFQNLNSYEWTPDMISFDADPSETVLSTSHHMVALLSGTRTTNTLPVTEDFDPLYYVAGWNNETGSHIFKAAVYNSTGDVPVSLAFAGVRPGTEATLTVLTAPDGYSHNDVGTNVVETSVKTLTAGWGGSFHFSLPDLSVAVLETNSSSGSAPGPYGHHGPPWEGPGSYGSHGRPWTA